MTDSAARHPPPIADSPGTVSRTLAALDLQNRRTFLLFVGPTVVVLVAIIIFPMVYSLATAFRFSVLYKPQASRFVGFSNFSSLLGSEYTQVAFLNTAIYTLITVTIEMVAGFFLALLLSRAIYGARYFRTALMVPILISPIIVGLSWRFMYNPSIGIIDQALSGIGLAKINWLTDSKIAFWAVMVPDIWQWTPFVTLVLLAGIHSISPEIREAALLDGLRLRHMIRYIYLRMLVPVIVVILLIRFIDALKTFDVVFILTQGGPGLSTMLISIRTWTLGLINLNMGQAAALSYMIVLVMSVFVVGLLRLLKQRVG